MDDGSGLDGDVIANDGGIVSLDFGNVNDCPVADVGVVADFDGIAVSPDSGTVPHGRVGAECDVSDEVGGGRDEFGSGGDRRCDVVDGYDSGGGHEALRIFRHFERCSHGIEGFSNACVEMCVMLV